MLRVESIDLSKVVPDGDAVALLPEDVARRFRVLPIAYDPATRVLTVAMSDTFDVVALDQIAALLGGNIEVRTLLASEAEIPRRLAELDLKPDPDGRYRVNESYCFDTTWQAALRALVAASDVVLMDLRGFHAGNRGCRFELDVLAEAAHPRHVVLLFDAATNRQAAALDLAGAPSERFAWIEAGRLDGTKTEEVLGALFGNAA